MNFRPLFAGNSLSVPDLPPARKPRLCSRFSLLLLFLLPLHPATRPRYGATLRIEIHQSIETPDPPPLGRGIPDLSGPFTLSRWEPGRRAVFDANDAAPGGRPFLDSIEVTLGRPLRDQSFDLDAGKADLVELGPTELRRNPPGRRVWSSSPVRVLTLVFHPRVDDARVREALALAIDRTAIHTVLSRQGEISAALLPQWLSGYAFLFPTAADPARARALAAGARPLTLGFDDPALRPVAERIALDASAAAGLAVTVIPQPGLADVRLTELRVAAANPAIALAAMAAALGLPEPTPAATPDALYAAERALLDGFRVIPLIHLPDVYGAGPRVHGAPGITPLGEWRFENLWLEGGRP